MTRAANRRKEKAKDKEVSATSYVSGRKADGWTCVGGESHMARGVEGSGKVDESVLARCNTMGAFFGSNLTG